MQRDIEIEPATTYPFFQRTGRTLDFKITSQFQKHIFIFGLLHWSHYPARRKVVTKYFRYERNITYISFY